MNRIVAVIIGWGLVSSSAALAAPVLQNFDSVPVGIYTTPLTLDSVTFTSSSGSLSVFFEAGCPSPPHCVELPVGSTLTVELFNPVTSAGAFMTPGLNFNSYLSSASAIFRDSADTVLGSVVVGVNQTIGVPWYTWDAGAPLIKSIEFSVTGIGGDPVPSWMFDYLLTDVRPVPVPATVVLFSSGLLGLVGTLGRMRKNSP